jgi:RND family efflux transporter MFP subunit
MASAHAADTQKAALPRSTVATDAAQDAREIRAQITPKRYTTLSAEVGAKISRLPVQEGGAFRSGQTLIQFDCSLPRAQLDKAKAMLGASEKTWQANKRLSELNSIGQVELEVSEAEFMKAQAEVAASSTLLSKCNVYAPFSGRIAEQKVREQQYVQPGQALLEIIDDSVLELEFIVPSRWLAWVRVGTAFQVKIDETGKTYPAKVQRIAAKVDPVSQSVKLTGVINGKFNDVVVGMSGQVLMTPPN